jgi:hypothetical protein
VPEVSDIDMALLLAAPLARTDAEQVAAVAAYCAAAHPIYGRRLSLFWSSAEAFADAANVQAPGRFPALDRLDLVAHGRRIGGEELREGLSPPTRAAVLENSREDLLRFVRDPARYGFLTGGAALEFGDRKALTRFCLFPARFIYTAATGQIASNDVAVEYFRAHATGPGPAIVALGLALRQDVARALTADDRTLLADDLPSYYRQFLRDFLEILGQPLPAEGATFPMLLAALDEARVVG